MSAATINTLVSSPVLGENVYFTDDRGSERFGVISTVLTAMVIVKVEDAENGGQDGTIGYITEQRGLYTKEEI